NGGEVSTRSPLNRCARSVQARSHSRHYLGGFARPITAGNTYLTSRCSRRDGSRVAHTLLCMYASPTSRACCSRHPILCQDGPVHQGIKPSTRPRPVTGLCNQPSLYRIVVHVIDLFDA